jgi:hypothetical protein
MLDYIQLAVETGSLDFARGCMAKSRPSPAEFRQDVDARAELPAATTDPGQVIQFSSPMPWVLAIVLSVAIWAVMGWLLWRYIHG